VRISFLGLFDTVSSVGWFWNPLSLPYTSCNPSVDCVRHAVAIDERRAFFRTNLCQCGKEQDFKEVWFAGVHSDVGGGYENNEQGLAQVAFAWMAREAAAKGLGIDQGQLVKILSGAKYSAPDPMAAAHESLDWRWRALEFAPKPCRPSYTDRSGVVHRQFPVRFNLGRRRNIPRDATLHTSVVSRFNAGTTYRPRNLSSLGGHPVEV
jgi:uncharacterized protein (DUF2235 family)